MNALITILQDYLITNNLLRLYRDVLFFLKNIISHFIVLAEQGPKLFIYLSGNPTIV